MEKNSYKQSLDTAIQELSDLMERRENLESQLEELNGRIGTVKFAIEGLSGLCGETPKEKYPHLFPEVAKLDAGFTEAIRDVFRNTPTNISLSPVTVRDKLQEKGFDVSRYKNPLASIHTILKRLRGSYELETREEEGRVRYARSKHLKQKGE